MGKRCKTRLRIKGGMKDKYKSKIGMRCKSGMRIKGGVG